MKILFLFFALFLPLAVDAVTFSVELNDQYHVSVYLDTEGELVNAVEGRINFPSDLLTLKEFRDGNSVVPLWIEKTGGRFSGIIPGGYRGERGLLFSITFLPVDTGTATFSFTELTALRNDGVGTPLPTTSSALEFKVSTEPLLNDQSEDDTTPPESFTIVRFRDQTLFEGKEFLVFSTTDKGSGVAEQGYRVCEWYFSFLGCSLVNHGPYLLTRWPTPLVRVDAADNAGQVRQEVLFTLWDAVVAAGLLLGSILLVRVCILYCIKYFTR